MKKVVVLGVLSLVFGGYANAQTCEEYYANALRDFYQNCGDLQVGCETWGRGEKSIRVTEQYGQRFYTCVVKYCPDSNGNPVEGEWHPYGTKTVPCANTPQIPAGGGGPPGGGGSGSGGGGNGGGCFASGAPGSDKTQGSVVSIQSRALGEVIPIVGAGFNLFYYSGYQLGRVSDFQIKYPLSTATPRDYITSFTLETRRGGVLLDTQTISNTANQEYVFTWNGLDSLGTPIDSDNFELIVNEVSPSGTATYPKNFVLGHWDVKKIGLGGWAPQNLTKYIPSTKTLFYASGEYRKVIAKAYGTGQFFVASDDGSEVYIFDAAGNHIQTRSALLGAVLKQYAYDSVGRLISVTEPFSKVTTFNRNSSGVLTSITAPNGQITSVSIDPNGYLATVTNPKSETYTLSYYSTQGLLYTFTKPNGEISEFDYDSEGYLLKDEHSGGYFFDLVKNINTPYAYDITKTTAMGRNTRYQTTLEDAGVVQKTTLPNGSVFQKTYYNGSPNSRADSGGGYNIEVQSVSHNRFGDSAKTVNQVKIQPNSGGATTYNISESVSLSDVNNPFSISSLTSTTSIGGTSSSITKSFNPVTKKFSISSTLGKTAEQTIDDYERVVSTKIGSLEATNFIYTNENLTSIQQGLRNTTITYNSAGLIQSLINPLLHTTSYTYDFAGRPIGKILPDARAISFAYDGVGNLVSITPPGKPTHVFGFNSHGLVSSYEPPALSGVATVNTTYSYNLDKQVTNVARPDGNYLSYTYNSSTGVLQNIGTLAGTYYYDFNSMLGLPSGITTPSNVFMSLSYVGKKISMIQTIINPSPFIGAYGKSYGVQDRVDSDFVMSGGSGTTTSTINYLYNDDQDMRQAGDVVINYSYPNGALTGTEMGSGPTAITDSYSYNSFGEVTAYQAKWGTTVIYDLSLTLDASGRINGKTESMNSITNIYDYDFDSSGRLEQVRKNSTVVSNYGYDSNSNRVSGNVGAQPTSATYDDQDRLLTYNTFSFTYNANGELAAKTNLVTSEMTQYSYDVLGNLTRIVLPDGITTITYEIDGLNRRVGKKINGVVQQRWVYSDRNQIVAELDPSGAITKRFVYGSKSNIPDYMIVSGENYRILSDRLGSPRLVVKQSDGSIAQRMNHNEFGRVLEDTNPGFTPFGFAGGTYDFDSGLTRFGARDFDSEVGRWTSKDPVLFEGGDTNLFGYVLQDPVNLIDSEGKNATTIGIGVGVGISIVNPPLGLVIVGMCALAIPGDTSNKNQCPEGYEAAKANCYANTKPNSDARHLCFASAYNRCVKGK